MNNNSKIDSVRIDKWLWATRFYKTRSLAVHAIDNGRVLVDGKRVKPARIIKINDAITINKEGLIYDVIVSGIIDKRQSAKIAVQMYNETEQSIINRQKMQEIMTISNNSRIKPDHKPNKKERRDLISFKHYDD